MICVQFLCQCSWNKSLINGSCRQGGQKSNLNFKNVNQVGSHWFNLHGLFWKCILCARRGLGVWNKLLVQYKEGDLHSSGPISWTLCSYNFLNFCTLFAFTFLSISYSIHSKHWYCINAHTSWLSWLRSLDSLDGTEKKMHRNILANRHKCIQLFSTIIKVL